jgi:hypothetical protein
MTVGSGGGTGSGAIGTNGGGAIVIETANLIVNGTISADSNSGSPSAGGGAGGSIYIKTNVLGGSGGYFSARGGSAAGTGDPGAGGGGRIAIYYNTSTLPNLEGSVSARGGLISWAGAGGNGTVILVDEDNLNVTFIGGRFQGASGAASETTNTVFYNASNPGLWNVNNVKLTGLTYSDVNMTLNASGKISFENVSYGGTNFQMFSISNAQEVEFSRSSLSTNLDITGVGNLLVDSFSSLSASSLGYPRGAGYRGPGNNVGGCTEYDSRYGAAHGGAGEGTDEGYIYGSSFWPTTVGSGACNGDGGGTIIILAVNATILGSIGADGSGGCVAGGRYLVAGASAGSILINTTYLNITGSLSAQGTNCYGSADGGFADGGGGRIAVYYSEGTVSDNVINTWGVDGGWYVTPGGQSGAGWGGGERGTMIVANLKDRNVWLSKGFRFQGITGQASESTNLSFFVAGRPSYLNVQNLTIFP